MTVHLIFVVPVPVPKRWESLVNQFNKEKRERKNKPSGSGLNLLKNGQPRKGFSLFSQMTFLLDNEPKQSTTNSITGGKRHVTNQSIDDDSNEIEDGDSDSDIATPTPTPKAKKFKSAKFSQPSAAQELVQLYKDQLSSQSTANSKPDSDTMFFDFLLSLFKKKD